MEEVNKTKAKVEPEQVGPSTEEGSPPAVLSSGWSQCVVAQDDHRLNMAPRAQEGEAEASEPAEPDKEKTSDKIVIKERAIGWNGHKRETCVRCGHV